MDSTIKELFEKAAVDIKASDLQLDNDTLLMLYGYYKQGTEGDCNISSPGFWDLKGKAKYNAWKDREGTTQEKAMKKYIKHVNKLLNKETK
jgi:diazepam-binding inhibitor (GABA receptor modulating acyl-CoA-binding protein)